MLSKAGLVPGGPSYADLCSWLHFSFLKVGDKKIEELDHYIQTVLGLSLSLVPFAGPMPLHSG